MERKIVTTSDGSHSLYVPELDEHYHSIHGAVQESRHVFIAAGLEYMFGKGASELRILEIGLGTGLNALLTFLEAEKKGKTIHYTAVEAYPLSEDLADRLNYSDIDLSSGKVFKLIHSSEWQQNTQLSDNFNFIKHHSKLEDLSLDGRSDLIYFDAFGPPVQPEMWTDSIFQKLYTALNDGGCLVTYCAKGEVKRVMKRAGFTVESLAGPPGKREMIRALKN